MSQNKKSLQEENPIDSITSTLRTESIARTNQTFDIISKSYERIIYGLMAKNKELLEENKMLKSEKKVRVVKTRKIGTN